MSRLIGGRSSSLARLADDYRDRLPGPFAHRRPRGSPPGLVVAGALALGLAALAFYMVAPDVKRYIKIQNM